MSASRTGYGRREFIKRGALFLPTIFIPRLIHAQSPLTAEGLASFIPAAAGGGGCGNTLNTGNVVNQTFAAAGTPSGWTANGSTLTTNSALSGAPCQLPATGLRAQWSGATGTWMSWDRGSSAAGPFWFRFYFNVNATTMGVGGGNWMYITAGSETLAAQNAFIVLVEPNTSDSDLRIWAQGTNASSKISIAAATWYRLEAKYTANSSSNELKIFDASNSQVGSTVTYANTGNKFFREFVVGVPNRNNGATADVYISGVGIDSTGYIGT